MKWFKYVLLILFVVSGCATRRLLFKSSDVIGWELDNYEVYESQKEFENVLDNVSLYMAYGLKKMFIQELSTKANNRVKIEIYFTDSNSSARSLYRRYQSLFTVDVGESGSESPGLLSFYRNKCFVKIYAIGNFPNQDQRLRTMGEQLDSKLNR